MVSKFAFTSDLYRYMTAGQCVGEGPNKNSASYTNGLSCVNDDAMIGI
jgi:hypothetical protein